VTGEGKGRRGGFTTDPRRSTGATRLIVRKDPCAKVVKGKGEARQKKGRIGHG